MHLSQLASSIPASPTLKLNSLARSLKQRGEAIIHLGGGEPENKTPAAAVAAAVATLQTGNIKYTPTAGIPGLKKAIIQYTEQNYGRIVKPENVIVSSGAKHALFNLLYAILDPDDEVIIPTPYWVSYPEMVRMMRGVPVMTPPREGTYLPDIAAIERAITPKTRAIIVNSPNNPSGMVYPEDFIAAVVELGERREIFIIMDDIYHQLVYSGQRPPSAYQFTSREVDTSHVIIINGVSKIYGMTGFRIGWTIAPQPIVNVMANIQAQSTSCNPTVDQAAAEGALLGPQDDVTNLRLTLQQNRDAMLEHFAATPAIRIPQPVGTFYCLADFRAFQNDSAALAQFLLEKALVVTVPGREFGMEGHLRLSYCGNIEDIIEGVERIRWALDPTTPREIRIGERTVVRDWL